MKDFKDIDLKNSYFLKLHRKEQIEKWHKQRKQAETDELRPILAIALALVVFMVLIYFDPLTVRFIFQGY